MTVECSVLTIKLRANPAQKMIEIVVEDERVSWMLADEDLGTMDGRLREAIHIIYLTAKRTCEALGKQDPVIHLDVDALGFFWRVVYQGMELPNGSESFYTLSGPMISALQLEAAHEVELDAEPDVDWLSLIGYGDRPPKLA